MKKCPFCYEDIQDDAIKCRFCNEFLPVRKKEPWYFSTGMMIFAFLCVGPFMLPQLWFHPTLAKKTKVVWTIIILVLTWGLFLGLQNAFKSLKEYYGLWLGNYPQ